MSQYANKDETQHGTVNSTIIEQMVLKEVENVLDDLTTIIPDVKHLISHILDITYDLQSKYVDVSLQKVNYTNAGLWKTSISINT